MANRQIEIENKAMKEIGSTLCSTLFSTDGISISTE